MALLPVLGIAAKLFGGVIKKVKEKRLLKKAAKAETKAAAKATAANEIFSAVSQKLGITGIIPAAQTNSGTTQAVISSETPVVYASSQTGGGQIQAVQSPTEMLKKYWYIVAGLLVAMVYLFTKKK